MFPWIAEPWNEEETVLRCEVCGMATRGGRTEPAEARAAAERAAEATPNRAGLAAWIGGGAWAGLDPETRFFFTPDSLSRLQPDPRQAQPSPAMSIALMWQTLQNSFTFGRNLALGRRGRAVATPAGESWQRTLDAIIVVATALPLLLVAAVLEIPAALAGRGAVLRRD